jgi:hypothetical protein
MNRMNLQAGMGQVVPLVVIAVVLAVGYVAIDVYSGGQKDMLTVESRGVQLVSALSKFRRETGAYPDALDKLVPKYAAAVGKCPDGTPMNYAAIAGEYMLSCPNVVFKYKPYSYDSRLKNWSG